VYNDYGGYAHQAVDYLDFVDVKLLARNHVTDATHVYGEELISKSLNDEQANSASVC